MKNKFQLPMLPPIIMDGTSSKIKDFLLENRMVFLNGYIEDTNVQDIITSLFYLDLLEKKDITLYINSPGGSVPAGLALYDVMQGLRSNVSTVVFGMAASMAQILLTAGAKGKRYAYPNSQIMMHQPLGGTEGQITDMEIQVSHFTNIKKKLAEIVAKHSKKQLKKVQKDAERDLYMSVQEALSYGLIDKIL